MCWKCCCCCDDSPPASVSAYGNYERTPLLNDQNATSSSSRRNRASSNQRRHQTPNNVNRRPPNSSSQTATIVTRQPTTSYWPPSTPAENKVKTEIPPAVITTRVIQNNLIIHDQPRTNLNFPTYSQNGNTSKRSENRKLTNKSKNTVVTFGNGNNTCPETRSTITDNRNRKLPTKSTNTVSKENFKESQNVIETEANRYQNLLEANAKINDWNSLTVAEAQAITRPSLEQFMRILLTIDLEMLDEDYDEDVLTNHMSQFGLNLPNFSMRELPLTYASIKAYTDTYLPLIMYDSWAQIVKDRYAKSSENDPVDERLNKLHTLLKFETMNVNNFIFFKLRALIPSCSTPQSDPFNLRYFIVIMQHPSGAVQTLGYVQDSRKLKTKGRNAVSTEGLPMLAEKNTEDSYIPIEYTVQLVATDTNRLFEYQSMLVIRPIHYFGPTMRNLESLILMAHKPYFESSFLAPTQTACEPLKTTRVPRKFDFVGKDTFNREQMEAIVGCFNAVERSELFQSKTVMIQGPPGTGKSHTLVGIVRNLFANSKESDSLCILICTPSNGAIDEIGRRLICDEELVLKTIVRIGNSDKVAEEMKKYTLDWLSNESDKRFEQLLDSANIILSTLNSVQLMAMALFRKRNAAKRIGCVIVDEASQCTEPELLMPLVYPCSKLILIGDHLQLPATVISRMALKLGLGRSMFERLYRHFDSRATVSPVLTLVEQYRMQPMISAFPSEHFYEDRLITPPGTGHNVDIPLVPYLVFNLLASREGTGSGEVSGSKYNKGEAEFVFRLVTSILENLGYNVSKKRRKAENRDLPEKLPISIGIITFYRGQKQELTRRFRQQNRTLLNHVDINTVDSFQGQECDIVILSCVRAFNPTSDNNSVGFVRSKQRMNVALTRAKSALYVCMNAASFTNVPHWRELLADAKKRNCFRPIKPLLNNDALAKMIAAKQ